MADPDDSTPKWLKDLGALSITSPFSKAALEHLNLSPSVGTLGGNVTFGFGDPALSARLQELESQISELRRRSGEQANALQKEQSSAKHQQEHIKTLRQTLEELKAKESLGFILGRVSDAAKSKLLESPEFQQQFLKTRECDAVVMAVDIRRSTDLMLKARRPEDFAEFITTLCRELMRIVIDSGGVFDKFTGDGVLAFYPDFYSGPDAAYRAVSAADDCHAAFRNQYHQFRKSFTSVLTDVGLGIGIDYGKVHLVEVAGGLTVVGGPVVYACRLSGAPSNTTFVNQPAFEVLAEKTGGSFLMTERDLDIKHEGKMLAYEVRLNARNFVPAEAPWMSVEQTKAGAGEDKSAPKLAIAPQANSTAKN